MNMEHWIALAKARRLVGGHAGPPCETYSAARWLPPDNGIFPRPLRDGQNPWGCGFRQLHEVWQCHVGTILMLAAIRILLWIYIFGGSISLEHPKGDNECPDKWSIWRSGFLKQLLLAADAQLTTFLQGPLGQNFAKPTTIFSARLPDLAQQIYSQYDLQWRPTEWLGGKSGGAWRTSKAKVYPEKLCRALAFSHMRHAETLCCDGFSSLPEHLTPVIEALSKLHDPYDEEATGPTMCPDFHRNSV